MKTLYVSLMLIFLLSACNLPASPTQANMPARPTPTAALPTDSHTLNRPTETAAPPQTGRSVLLFTIGMHIEPKGKTAQGYGSSANGDYNDPKFFQRGVEDILAVTGIVEAHGGRMTIQAQSPFTSVAIQSGNPILANLAERGHEIALHFHEDAHLGQNSSARSVEEWCDAMKQEIALIQQASGVSSIRYWSGGNIYPHTYEAAECAGLDVNSDWKNPQTQSTDLSLVGVNPWRPAGGTDGTDLTLFAQHDPNGAIIFLPEGQYDQSNFASMRRSEQAGGDAAYFEYLKTQLYASLEASQPDQVNVFHFTVHPGEFRGDPQHPFEVIDRFLSEVIDPLVASGQVRWATFSEMADAYQAADVTLLEQAQTATPERYQFALDQGAKIIPTTDGKSFLLWWLPQGSDPANPPPVIVTLHGHSSWAFDEFFLWQPYAAQRGYGILALQWWFGGGEEMSDYYLPQEMYPILENALRVNQIRPQTVLLHGFSRGSANTYGVTALDRASGNNFFLLTIANSGGAASDFAINQSIEKGEFGPQPFSNTNWVMVCGMNDPNPNRDGCPAMRNTSDWVTRYGGTVNLLIEDPNGDHGAFHRNPQNVNAALDVFAQLLNQAEKKR